MATVRQIPKCPLCNSKLRHQYYGSFCNDTRKANGWYCKKGHGPYQPARSTEPETKG